MAFNVTTLFRASGVMIASPSRSKGLNSLGVVRPCPSRALLNVEYRFDDHAEPFRTRHKRRMYTMQLRSDRSTRQDLALRATVFLRAEWDSAIERRGDRLHPQNDHPRRTSTQPAHPPRRTCGAPQSQQDPASRGAS